MVDLSYLRSICRNDASKLNQFITLYIEVSQQTFEKMQSSFEKKEWDQLRIQAHSLKPQAEYVGVFKLVEVIEKLEVACNSGHTVEIAQHFKEAQRINDEAVAQLSWELNAQK